MRRLALVLACLAAPLAAQAPVAMGATGVFTIAGESFAPADILDARAMPDMSGKAGIMLTLAPGAAARLASITAALAGKPMTVALDGKPLMTELIRGPIRDGVIEVPGGYSIAEAEALAMRISGKAPLPDELED